MGKHLTPGLGDALPTSIPFRDPEEGDTFNLSHRGEKGAQQGWAVVGGGEGVHRLPPASAHTAWSKGTRTWEAACLSGNNTWGKSDRAMAECPGNDATGWLLL